MNENNINPSSTQNKKKDNEKAKEKWEVVADILDELQSFVITEPTPMAHSVIKEAAQLIADRCWPPSSLPSSDSPFPIPNLQFSIVYQPYSDITLNVALERNQIISGDLKLDTSGLGNFQDRIEQVVRTGQVDLDSSGHNLIVPMRLDPKAKAKKGQYLPPRRIIGAFLLEADNDYSFKKEDARLFDRFSDGVAVLIQLGDSKARTEVTNKLHSEYLGNIGQFESEFEIFKKLIDSLTNNEIRYSYAVEEINILLYHSFYKDQLYIVCEDGKLEKNFRKEATYSFDSERLRSLLGDFGKQSNEIKEFISDDYPSNIVVPILVHHDNKIGYLILRTQQKNAYQNEKNLLRRAAGFLAATLRSFRHDSWEQQLDKFFIQNIENNAEDEQSWTDQDNIENEKSQADKKLYNAVVRVLEYIYGSVELAIVGLSLEDKTPAFTFKHGENWDELSLLTELKKYIYRVNLEPFRSENQKYYIYSITAESGRITNFFIIKMTRDSVRTTHRFIQHLLAMVGVKQSFMRKKERLISLTKFGEAITNEPNITLERAYELAYENTNKVMSTTNMYIALLNRKNQEVTFPLFKKKNKETGGVENIFVESRIFDHTSKGLPRTEYILATKERLLINTKEESIKWYENHGNSEKINDPFASWIGVPIISKGEAIGVIVVYHPSAEYLYTAESDGIFLENIAAYFSSLLVRVELENRSSELKEAKQNILLKESRLLKASFAKDLAHKQNNAIGGALAQVNIARVQIESNGNLSLAKESLNDVSEELTSYLKSLESISSPQREKFKIHPIINSYLNTIKTEKKLFFADCFIEKNAQDIEMFNYKPLIDSLIYTLIDNAGDSIKIAAIENSNRGFYIKVNTKLEDGKLIVDIKDNALMIDSSVANKLFKEEITTKTNNDMHGYGLFRAKEITDTLGGDIYLKKNTEVEKIFRIVLPIDKIEVKQVLVIDDRRIWRNIISTYAKNIGYDVLTADSIESAVSNLRDFRSTFDVVFLDLSFDFERAGDSQGLTLIQHIKETNPNSKIIVVSGFPEKAQNYKDDIDLIIPKVVSGNVIGEEKFREMVLKIL